MKSVIILIALAINFTAVHARPSTALANLTAFVNVLARVEQDPMFARLQGLSATDVSGALAAALGAQIARKYRTDFDRYVPEDIRAAVQLENTLATLRLTRVYLSSRGSIEALDLAARVADDVTYRRMAAAEWDLVRFSNFRRWSSLEPISIVAWADARTKFSARFEHEFDLVKYMLSLKHPAAVVRVVERPGQFPLVTFDPEAAICRAVEWNVLPASLRDGQPTEPFRYAPYPVAALNYLTCDTFLTSAPP